MQVLHMDRNNYYGGDSASLNLNQVGRQECVPCSRRARGVGTDLRRHWHACFIDPATHLFLTLPWKAAASFQPLPRARRTHKHTKPCNLQTHKHPHARPHALMRAQLFERFRPGQAPPPSMGSSRDYNVDMVPKFIMGNGKLVRVLIHTNVTRYLEFKAVDGSYVLNRGRVEKVPATDMEALRSSLLGLFEKRRARKFFL